MHLIFLLFTRYFFYFIKVLDQPISQTTQPVVSWAGLCNYWLIKKVNQVRWIVFFSQPVDVSQTLWQLYWSPLFLGDKLSLKRWWIDINRMQFEPLHFSLVSPLSHGLMGNFGMYNFQVIRFFKWNAKYFMIHNIDRLCCFRQDQVLKVNILKILKAFFFLKKERFSRHVPKVLAFLDSNQRPFLLDSSP